jgi:uncharacterized membrane protein YtjA (UPF0391 family)
MLRWSLIFLVFALIAGLFGFTDIAGESMQLAKILFVVFLVIFAVGAVVGLVHGKKLTA